jgi:hypothetical protein
VNRVILEHVLFVMKNIQIRWLALPLTMIFTLEMSGLAANGGPAVQVIDGRLSVKADAVPLGWFLKTLDKATGMSSTLPANLANRNISVQFSNLSFDDAVHKIFEGQRLDYVLVQGEGIIITGTAQVITSSDQGSSFVPPPPEIFGNAVNFNSPNNDVFVPPLPTVPQPGQVVPVNGQEPAMIQTPFGPIPNPRANQGVQSQANPANPSATPNPQQPFGSQGTPFGQSNPFGIGSPAAPSNLPNTVLPGTAPASPFGNVLPGQTQPRE